MTTASTPCYRRWFWGLALAGFALDLGAKYLAFGAMAPGEAGRIELVPRVFSLVHQERLNQGALFGFGNTPETGWIANIIFALVSGVAIAGISLWSFRTAFARDRWLCLALGLILGGAAGNFFDRLLFGGVRDFLWVYYQNPQTGELDFNWPVFNIADAWLVIGAGLLLVQAFFCSPSSKQMTNSQAPMTKERAITNAQ